MRSVGILDVLLEATCVLDHDDHYTPRPRTYARDGGGEASLRSARWWLSYRGRRHRVLGR
jgi:hypothetical protein